MGEKLDFLGLWLIGAGNLIKLMGDTLTVSQAQFHKPMNELFLKNQTHCRRQDYLSHLSEVETRLWLPRKFSYHSDGGAVVQVSLCERDKVTQTY